VDRWASEEVVRSEPGKPRLTSFSDRRDRALFNEAYEDPESGIFTGRAKVGNPEFTGPITYVGQKEVEADVKLLKDAMAKYYETESEVIQACGAALSHEYKAITDAGLTVQFDAPDLAEAWDQINPEPSIEDFRGFVRERIDVLNESIKDIPKELTRLHICW